LPKGKLTVFLEAVFLPLKTDLRLISKKSTAENCTDFRLERKISQKDALRIKEIIQMFFKTVFREVRKAYFIIA